MRAAESLTSTLRQKSSAQAPGEKLPSVRAIMKRYGASLHSVNIALRQLETEGLIDVRKGSGIYVSPRKGVRYIELHRLQYPSMAADAKEISLGRAITKEGWKMLVKRHPTEYDDPDIQPNPKACAHIVMPGLFEINPLFFKQITSMAAPVLVYGRMAGPFQMDYVTGDDYQYLSLLIKHLRGLGHQRMAFLANEPASPPLMQRSEIFLNIAELFELPEPIIIDCKTRLGESSMYKAYEGLKNYLGEHGNKPPVTAVISSSQAGVLGALRACHETGVSVPRDCSVVSFGLAAENALMTPSVTEAGAAEESWGEGCISVLKQRFENPQGPSIGLKLPPQLFVRESTAPPRA